MRSFLQKTKIARLQESLPMDMDALLVTEERNCRYLTGFSYTDGYVLVTRDKCWLITDFRYLEAAKASVKNFEICIVQGKREDFFAQLFAEVGIRRIGFESSTMSVDALRKWQGDHSNLVWVPAGKIVEHQRELKDAYEVECIIQAQRIAERSLSQTLQRVLPDMTEREFALELEFQMRRNGAEGSAFEIISVSGAASSLPHGVPRDVKLEKGFFTVDFGAIYNGYLSDMTRTFVIGKADAKMKEIYKTVLEAQLAGIDAVKSGALCREVDRKARDLIDGAGYQGCFGHSLGHGVGMFIHEEPRLSPAAGDRVLKVGHIVTVEPGIYIEGTYGVRIEDMMYVSESGSVNLTEYKKDLIELFS